MEKYPKSGGYKLAQLSRRSFLKEIGIGLSVFAFPSFFTLKQMNHQKIYDVIIVGGSYSGLSAAMALGRALKTVLIIDDGKPCNRQTPFSHNFITHDGEPPARIAAKARQKVSKYDTIQWVQGLAVKGVKTDIGFEISLGSGEQISAKKILFATGIRDLLPEIEGLAACWGISVIHCPYCHGYEVKNVKTGVLGKGEGGFEFSRLISNWTKDLTLLTNGPAGLSEDQWAKLRQHQIPVIEQEIERVMHTDGQIQAVKFKDGESVSLTALYAPSPFEQSCPTPESLGCPLTSEGYLKTDSFQETTIPGIYAAGDNASKMRTVSNAVSTGTVAGISISKKLIQELF